uniref:BAH domain-containing protein n=1 Tax=Chenopodium quinoa TaxID=63459 RepID=A0A803L8S7_CHEQI
MDVRKINVGDCALFKPQQDSPPFIGIIRSLGSDKENNLQLGVNWLYRPADVKLLKGLAPEAAPNEVFYSFHRDETPAASLLHPCKVAFLPRGVELPSGISSFVCRRVYDTANKRLWWLTDQDYIDGRQEEVDQLIRKTQLEMHTTVQQQGGRSPKPVNSPMSTSQLKHSPDSVQNSSTVYPSQSKGKKRERSDQSSEPVKRERSSKADDVDFSLPRTEGMLKFEIDKITEKGGL